MSCNIYHITGNSVFKDICVEVLNIPMYKIRKPFPYHFVHSFFVLHMISFIFLFFIFYQNSFFLTSQFILFLSFFLYISYSLLLPISYYFFSFFFVCYKTASQREAFALYTIALQFSYWIRNSFKYSVIGSILIVQHAWDRCRIGSFSEKVK